MLKIFISYRRDDSAAFAGRVNDRLEREFGRESLFIDVDAIPLGVDFVEAVAGEVAKCHVLLSIIGPRWLDARDEEGGRRLDNQTDFVRIEIASALRRNIPVIPILLDGARIPRPEQLPEELKALSVRNALEVRHVSFHADINRLIAALNGEGKRLEEWEREAERKRQEELEKKDETGLVDKVLEPKQGVWSYVGDSFFTYRKWLIVYVMLVIIGALLYVDFTKRLALKTVAPAIAAYETFGLCRAVAADTQHEKSFYINAGEVRFSVESCASGPDKEGQYKYNYSV